jgi:hypothetical protein
MVQRGAARAWVPLALAAAVLGAWGAAFAADEKPTSGLPVGANTPPFQVQDITGPAKGKQLCYV